MALTTSAAFRYEWVLRKVEEKKKGLDKREGPKRNLPQNNDLQKTE